MFHGNHARIKTDGAPSAKERAMKRLSRRQFLATASAGTLALTGSFTKSARAQSTITMRISSSMSADQNAAHYIWYERFAANVQSSLGDKVKLGYFPDSQLGKEADIVQQVKVGSVDMMITGECAATDLAAVSLRYFNVAGAAFAQVTNAGVSQQRLAVNMDALNKFLRVVDTITGTTPSFTRSVNLLGRKQVFP